MGTIQWRDIRVGAALLVVAIPLVAYAPRRWAILVLSILAAILLLVGIVSNIDRWRHQEMDPAHAKWIQAIAKSVDHSVTSGNGKADYSDGESNPPINATCFRADYPEISELIDRWEATYSVLPRQIQETQKMIFTSAQSLWPTLHPSTLADYAFEYTKKFLMNSPPPVPRILLMPEDHPSQLLQMTSSSSGKVLCDYGPTLRDTALAEAQRQCEALQKWVTEMFTSREAVAWRGTFVAQGELRLKISHKLQEIGVQPTLPRGKCQVCSGKK